MEAGTTRRTFISFSKYMGSQITGIWTVCSMVQNQRNLQRCVFQAPVVSLHKGSVKRNAFPCHDVILLVRELSYFDHNFAHVPVSSPHQHWIVVLWVISHYPNQSYYNDVIMTTMASQITTLTVVYSTVYSDADQRQHQIPHTKGQLRGKCFHLMTSSWSPTLSTFVCVIRQQFWWQIESISWLLMPRFLKLPGQAM